MTLPVLGRVLVKCDWSDEAPVGRLLVVLGGEVGQLSWSVCQGPRMQLQ